MLRQAQNPMAMLQQMAGNNPLMARAMQMGQGRGENELKVIAQNLARAKGMSDSQLSQFLSPFGLRL